MNRRKFLKLVPGLAALPLVGKLLAHTTERQDGLALRKRMAAGFESPALSPDLCPLCEKPMDSLNEMIVDRGVRVFCLHPAMGCLGIPIRSAIQLTIRNENLSRYRAQLLRRREMELGLERDEWVRAGNRIGKVGRPYFNTHRPKIEDINAMLRRVEEAMK